jgi:hypothetical protein
MTNNDAMLTKTTKVYAHHGLPLECDVYDAADYPEDAPAVLYFHPGGLVDWGRDCLAPWLVQVGSQRAHTPSHPQTHHLHNCQAVITPAQYFSASGKGRNYCSCSCPGLL